MFTQKDNALEATFTFNNFTEAFSFMTHVAFYCEKLNHHPNWTNVYNRVHVQLTTHDAGNTVTEKDHQLAKAIEMIYNKE